MTTTNTRSQETYQPPAVKVLGTLHELTLISCTDKKYGASDGYTLMGVAITCNSG